jgi:hypothetical protein
MEVASIILATAAFIVAVWSLYVGNLRRADIETSLPRTPIPRVASTTVSEPVSPSSVQVPVSR